MTIVFKNITLRNFLSIGAVTQSINFDRQDLTLILGENLDLGGDGARNGTGKTTLIQGLSYALYGEPINKIRKDNLVNRTNTKGMVVSLEFSANGKDYKIVRGRKPNILKFYVNNEEQKQTDDAQGENKETQAEIDRIIGMSHDLFKQIVILNTYSEPFLAMRDGAQRQIIEQLLGITLLSEKAEVLKGQIRETKDAIQAEEFRVKAVTEANKRIVEQIDSLKRRSSLWQTKHAQDLSDLATQYERLSMIDIDDELATHFALKEYQKQADTNRNHESLVAGQTAWQGKQLRDTETLVNELSQLQGIDIEIELAAHKEIARIKQQTEKNALITDAIGRIEADIKRTLKLVPKLEGEIASLHDHKCYACGQEFHDEKQAKVLADKETMLAEAKTHLGTIQAELTAKQADFVADVPKKLPKTHYKSESDAVKHSREIELLQQKIDAKKQEHDPYQEQISAIAGSVVKLGAVPKTIYDTEAEAFNHRSVMSSLESRIETKLAEQDPYVDQIADMEKRALQVVNFDQINALTKTMEHQKFVLDLLTNKDSFIRKRIIDQNLSHLNTRLTHYLTKIGLPHEVTFLNDLSIEITELGRELDFHNLSRGEMNRLILALSFAFRDVWESIYHPINALFIDELVDSGMDTTGVENSIALLKDFTRSRHKSVWLVSHKEELAGRVQSILKVVKENGFSTYASSVDMQ